LLAALGVALALSACSPPNGACSRYRSADDLLSSADAALSKRDFRAAGRFLDRGISLLGVVRAQKGELDDTAMALSAAREMERGGDLFAAVKTKQGVLETRLSHYAKANACPAPSRPPQ
jgi:hypothetical protein